MQTEPTPTQRELLHAELRRFALQVQAGFAGVIALSLVMLIRQG